MIALTTTTFVGCKTLPTVESVTGTSYAVGVSAAYVVNETKITDETRTAIANIMTEVKQYVPSTNQTFASAWTPIAERQVQTLVANGKINATQGAHALKTFKIAIMGMDYVIAVKYPKLREYAELIDIATTSFCDGFLNGLSQQNVMKSSATAILDEDALQYLRTYVKNHVK